MGTTAFENPTRRWRFTWESLAHIPALRLYLFRPPFDPSARCRSLSAALRLDRSLLLVSWIDGDGDGGAPDGAEVVLRVPVPRVLFDPSCPAECRARCDHIEVKLALALPLDHPLVGDFVAGVLDSEGDRAAAESGGIGVPDQLLPLSLDSDIKFLSSGAVIFFCKTCSTKLTRQPLSRFVEMPSSNWREVADNWFGSCCCSFGGISEKMVSKYIDKYNCQVGTCLLDSASVTICKDDLEEYVVQLECNTEDKPDDLVDICSVTESSKGGESGNCKEDIHNVGTTLTFSACKVGRTDMGLAKSPNINTKSYYPLHQAECCENVPNGKDSAFKGTSVSGQLRFYEASGDVAENMLDLNIDHCSEKPDMPFPVPLKRLSLENRDHCCGDNHGSWFSALSASMLSSEAKQDIQGSGLQGSLTSLHNGSFGGGFIVRTSNLFKDTKWIGFLCRNCSSPLGCYPSSKNVKFPIDGGIRLFKCFVSACHVDRSSDIFRKHTMPRVFMNLLLENADEELSYRIIVKDLESRSSRLLLVLLSSKAWWSTGYCIENVSGEEFSRTNMQPVVKLLFTECNDSSEANLRLIEEWSKKNHVEEVHMMPFLIEELITHLKSDSNSIPSSCSSFQGMCLSSLQR